MMILLIVRTFSFLCMLVLVFPVHFKEEVCHLSCWTLKKGTAGVLNLRPGDFMSMSIMQVDQHPRRKAWTSLDLLYLLASTDFFQ